MARAKVVQDPHVLFVGHNGKKAFGITVEALCTPAESKACGYQHTWNINDHLFFRSTPEDVMAFLGIARAEYDRLASLFRELIEAEAYDNFLAEVGYCDVL